MKEKELSITEMENLSVLIKALKDKFPKESDLNCLKYLNTQQDQLFWLTPVEFANLDRRCLNQILETINNLTSLQN